MNSTINDEIMQIIVGAIEMIGVYDYQVNHNVIIKKDAQLKHAKQMNGDLRGKSGQNRIQQERNEVKKDDEEEVLGEEVVFLIT